MDDVLLTGKYYVRILYGIWIIAVRTRGGGEDSIVNNSNTFFPLKHAHISLAIMCNVFFISSMYLSL